MGVFKNDKASGWGVYHKPANEEEQLGPIIMEGQFKNGVQIGFGRLKIIKEDTLYEGEFNRSGEREGWGVLFWPDNSVLEGFWSN